MAGEFLICFVLLRGLNTKVTTDTTRSNTKKEKNVERFRFSFRVASCYARVLVFVFSYPELTLL